MLRVNNINEKVKRVGTCLFKHLMSKNTNKIKKKLL